MPFDAAIALSRPASPAAALEQWGLSPVPWAELAAHKQAQLEKFGPSFWYRNRGLLLFGLMSPLFALVATGAFAQGLSEIATALPFYLIGAWMGLMPLLLASGSVRLRAGSHWEERWLPATALDAAGVPAPIAALARRMHEDVPGSTLILGELVRERVVLDPYLLLVRGGEQVCLGIWDGETIIARPR
jgi:hypothetical protein